MSLALGQRPSSLPWALRAFVLAVSVVFCMAPNTSGVGGQTSDDHGDTIATASDLPFRSSIEGRIDPANDEDVFRLDLTEESGTTDVWIYTTGDLDTVGRLLDGNGNWLVRNDDSFIIGRWTNFHLRASLPKGLYYVEVSSYRGQFTGDYTLYTEAVTDPGSTIDTATRLSLDSPTPGTIGTAGDADYFRLEFTEPKDLVIYAASVDSVPVDVVVLDSASAEITTNLYPHPDQVFGLPRYGFFLRDDFGPGAFYVKILTQTGVARHPAPYTIHAYEDVRYTDFIDECEAKTSQLNAPLIDDSLYACQWHLDSSNETDINVESVWEEGIKGEGVNVAVVDDGMYYAHEDLKDNVDASRNHDYTGNKDIYTPFEHNGTHATGLIAARDNDVGVRGVAPRATVYGYNFLADTTDLNGVDAMTRNRDVTAVSNNGWGPRDGPWLGRANAFWELAIETGITDGYGGKGVFYVFAGGNGGAGHQLNPDGTLAGGSILNAAGHGDDSNLDEFANFYGVTAVCAVNDHDTRSAFSEKGANLWVCAPSNDQSGIHRGILTTENSDRYYEDFGGTSASTPIVTGVAALIRSANPDLTWRDVKLILAASARKNDVRNPGWQDGARKYRSSSREDRYHFNHEYGFGVVDAKAAVDLARGWTTVPPLKSASASSTSATTIPGPSSGGLETVITELPLSTGIGFTEFVEIKADFSHASFRDMEIELETPSGAISKLAVPFNTRHYTEVVNGVEKTFYVGLDGEIRFGSARHLGEDPNGTWKLRLTDHFPHQDGMLRSWSLKVYGHESPPSALTLNSVTPDFGILTAAWAAPESIGSSPVTSYDMRYIQTAADETVGSNWTVVKDVWDVETGGSLEYVITSFVSGVRYDVQMRAVNRVGAGPWSITLSGTPTQETSGACGIGGAVADPVNNRRLVFDCNALLAARDALAGRAALNWSSSIPIADWRGVTVGGTPRRVTGLNLPTAKLTGTLPAELSRLDSLKRLVLRRNELSGPIPAWLGDLANLEELSLWGNRLYGPLPASLGNLVNLEALLLSRNPISGSIPAELGNLAELRELRLFDSQLTGPIPDELSGLAKLEVLQLSRNRLTGTLPNWLGDLAGLEVISIWDNEFTGPIPHELGALTNLEQLLLGENGLTGSIPESLGGLDRLKRLSLRENRLAGCVPGGLRDVESNDFDDLGLPFCVVPLEGLSTRSTEPSECVTSGVLVDSTNTGLISDCETLLTIRDTLAGTSSLNWAPDLPIAEWDGITLAGTPARVWGLFLHRNRLTGEIPAGLGKLSNLEWLSLYGNYLTGGIPTELADLSNLKRLYLNHNSLSGEIPSELGRMTSLTHLLLHRNGLSGGIPEGLAGMTKLAWLSLYGNELTGGIPRELGDLDNLKRLYLHVNQLDGEIPGELGKLAALNHLWLNKNNLSGDIPAELGGLDNLVRWRLSGNRLTGCVPTGLTAVTDNDMAALGLDVCP